MQSLPLEILHVRQSNNVWGPERGLLNVCRLLSTQGFRSQIAIVYRPGAGEPPEHPIVSLARAQGTPITQLEGRLDRLRASIRWLRRRIVDEGIAIVHCHEYKSDLMGALASFQLPVRRPALIATVRHTEPGLQQGAFQTLDSLVLHRFDRLTVPSHGALGELRRWPSLRRRTQVLHHSVDTRPGEPTPSSTPWPAHEGPVVSIVGRLQTVKGHRFFLEAARLVAAQRPDARFWIVGSGELRGDLEALTSQMGLTLAVSFLGYRSDAREAMRMSHVVVCASLYEAFPQVMLEALASERPVVATSVGGIPEIVVDGETGLLAPPRNAPALAAAVLRLLDDRDLAKRLASAGRARVAERYTTEVHASRLAALYREAAACR